MADFKGEEVEIRVLNWTKNEQHSDRESKSREVREIHWFKILISDT